jgi:hypothetical protein
MFVFENRLRTACFILGSRQNLAWWRNLPPFMEPECSFGFYKVFGNSLEPERRVAYRKGISSMELVRMLISEFTRTRHLTPSWRTLNPIGPPSQPSSSKLDFNTVFPLQPSSAPRCSDWCRKSIAHFPVQLSPPARQLSPIRRSLLSAKYLVSLQKTGTIHLYRKCLVEAEACGWMKL